VTAQLLSVPHAVSQSSRGWITKIHRARVSPKEFFRRPKIIISALLQPRHWILRTGKKSALHDEEKMVRKLKHHEQKLLRKVDFTTYASDNNHRDAAVIRRYNIQKPGDYQKYNRICGVRFSILALPFPPLSRTLPSPLSASSFHNKSYH
jgi:hypothetical protein